MSRRVVGASNSSISAAAPILSLIAGLCLGTSVPVSAEQPLRSPVARAQLDVHYDATADLVSIRAGGVRLRDVLREITRAAGVAIDSRDPELLDAPISSEIERASLERAIDQLLAGFNFSVTYRSRIPALDDGRDRIVSVRVLSTRSGGASQGQPAASAGTSATAKAAASPGVPLAASTSSALPADAAGLVQRLMDNRFAARDIVAFLATSADARLRAETEDALARILSEGDFRQYGAAIEVLKELAPEKAVGALSSWLGTGDRQMRVVAAASLGQIDSEQSVDALTAALGGRDALTRQAAASSLAQIRSDGARAALLDAYRSAGPDIQESIAIAIASHGDQSVQRALASVAAPLGSSARSLPVAGASWPGSNQQITQ